MLLKIKPKSYGDFFVTEFKVNSRLKVAALVDLLSTSTNTNMLLRLPNIRSVCLMRGAQYSEERNSSSKKKNNF